MSNEFSFDKFRKQKRVEEERAIHNLIINNETEAEVRTEVERLDRLPVVKLIDNTIHELVSYNKGKYWKRHIWKSINLKDQDVLRWKTLTIKRVLNDLDSYSDNFHEELSEQGEKIIAELLDNPLNNSIRFIYQASDSNFIIQTDGLEAKFLSDRGDITDESLKSYSNLDGLGFKNNLENNIENYINYYRNLGLYEETIIRLRENKSSGKDELLNKLDVKIDDLKTKNVYEIKNPWVMIERETEAKLKYLNKVIFNNKCELVPWTKVVSIGSPIEERPFGQSYQDKSSRIKETQLECGLVDKNGKHIIKFWRMIERLESKKEPFAFHWKPITKFPSPQGLRYSEIDCIQQQDFYRRSVNIPTNIPIENLIKLFEYASIYQIIHNY